MQPINSEACTVLIIGSGPAGLGPSPELHKAGVTGLKVVEHGRRSRGMPRFCHHTGFHLRDLQRLYTGPSYAHAYRQRVLDAGIPIKTATTITNWTDAHTVAAPAPSRH